MVVYIHSYGGALLFHETSMGGSIYEYISHLLSQEVFRVAVPLFYMISGYLLFYQNDIKPVSYCRVLLKKTRTLVVPYLFFNLLILTVYAVAQNIFDLYTLFENSKLISKYHMYDYFNAVLGFSGYPISYHFWFVRNLFLLFLIYPFLTIMLLSKWRRIFCWLAFILWLTSAIPSMVIEPLFFFYLGGYLYFNYRTIFEFDRYMVLLFFIFSLFSLSSPIFDNFGLLLSTKFTIISGVFFTLAITSKISKFSKAQHWLIKLSPASFFVFCLHEPLLSFSKKVLILLFSPSEVGFFIIIYLFLPLFIVSILTFSYFFCQVKFNFFMRLVFGR